MIDTELKVVNHMITNIYKGKGKYIASFTELQKACKLCDYKLVPILEEYWFIRSTDTRSIGRGKMIWTAPYYSKLEEDVREAILLGKGWKEITEEQLLEYKKDILEKREVRIRKKTKLSQILEVQKPTGIRSKSVVELINEQRIKMYGHILK